jgi:hypothetical protein
MASEAILIAYDFFLLIFSLLKSTIINIGSCKSPSIGARLRKFFIKKFLPRRLILRCGDHAILRLL